jgi:murein DD-endopeptidase MepM/ murein hydrolase activator NlpD
MRQFLLLCLLIAGIPVDNAEAKQPYPFSVTTEAIGNGQNLFARNRGPAPISVRVTLNSATNAVASQALPFQAVVRPNSEMVLLQIRPADPARGLRFSSQSAYNLGNFYARHDPQALYRLPFADGGSFVISQAADGPLTTHNGADSEYAVDFTLPENTPVVAARNGTVIESESANRLGGRDRALAQMANYVRILHADETVATYAHLAPNGVTVSPGQRVAAGALIGYSGATGYTSGPHLHFVVQKPVPTSTGFTMQSLPIRFYVGNPPYAFAPGTRQQVTADYTTPGTPPPLVNEKRAIQAR